MQQDALASKIAPMIFKLLEKCTSDAVCIVQFGSRFKRSLAITRS